MARTEPTPTYFFDPTATSSTGAGTFANPYNSIAQVVAGFTGNMAGQVLGIKRGTTIRVPSSGFLINCYGSSAGGLAQIRAYGDAQDNPILIASQTINNWARYSLDSRVWQRSNITSAQSIWYDGQRIEMRSSLDAMRAAGRGHGFWDGVSTFYFIPTDDRDPNLGQVEITSATNALQVNYTNVSATGFILVADLEFRGSRDSGLAVVAPGSTGSITSISTILISGIRSTRIGADGAGLGVDGILVYGVSDTLRIGNLRVESCTGTDILNNLIEVGAISSGYMGNNSATLLGGNVVELWYSCSNTDVAYNTVTNFAPQTRLTNYHNCGIWQTGYTTVAGTSPDATRNVSNSFYGNLIVSPYQQGLDLYGNTLAVFNNTVFNASLAGTGAAACWLRSGTCAVNNNLFHLGQTGAANLYGDTGTTLTGDRNVYSRVQFSNANNYWNGVFQANLAAWKASATPQFQNDSTIVPASLGIDSAFRPTPGSALLNAGGTVAAWTKDLDGDAIRGAPSIGCYQTRYAAMTQTCASEG